MSVRNGVTVRGTSNGNQRGNSEQRRARRAWLLATYAADEQMTRIEWQDGAVDFWHPHTGLPIDLLLMPEVVSAESVPTARCYRCGTLLVDETITVDRIIPGCHGGTYRRTNIRPACGKCNSDTGAPLRSKRKEAR